MSGYKNSIICRWHEAILNLQPTACFGVLPLCRTTVCPCPPSEQPRPLEIARSSSLSVRELFPSSRRSTWASLSRPQESCTSCPTHRRDVSSSAARLSIVPVQLLQRQNNTCSTAFSAKRSCTFYHWADIIQRVLGDAFYLIDSWRRLTYSHGRLYGWQNSPRMTSNITELDGRSNLRRNGGYWKTKEDGNWSVQFA